MTTMFADNAETLYQQQHGIFNMLLFKKMKEQLIFGSCVILIILTSILFIYFFKNKKQESRIKNQEIQKSELEQLTTEEWIKYTMRPK